MPIDANKSRETMARLRKETTCFLREGAERDLLKPRQNKQFHQQKDNRQ